jgi:colicin import membrane protein
MDFEMTPEDIVRRAAWNKGLRCRRDYGPEKIPFAFVKGKVAVYVTDGARTSVHEKLEADDWKVLIFNTADVTDGEVEALAIKDAIKENLRDLKKKKKK